MNYFFKKTVFHSHNSSHLPLILQSTVHFCDIGYKCEAILQKRNIFSKSDDSELPYLHIKRNRDTITSNEKCGDEIKVHQVKGITKRIPFLSKDAINAQFRTSSNPIFEESSTRRATEYTPWNQRDDNTRNGINRESHNRLNDSFNLRLECDERKSIRKENILSEASSFGIRHKPNREKLAAKGSHDKISKPNILSDGLINRSKSKKGVEYNDSTCNDFYRLLQSSLSRPSSCLSNPTDSRPSPYASRRQKQKLNPFYVLDQELQEELGSKLNSFTRGRGGAEAGEHAAEKSGKGISKQMKEGKEDAADWLNRGWDGQGYQRWVDLNPLDDQRRVDLQMQWREQSALLEEEVEARRLMTVRDRGDGEGTSDTPEVEETEEERRWQGEEVKRRRLEGFHRANTWHDFQSRYWEEFAETPGGRRAGGREGEEGTGREEDEGHVRQAKTPSDSDDLNRSPPSSSSSSSSSSSDSHASPTPFSEKNWKTFCESWTAAAAVAAEKEARDSGGCRTDSDSDDPFASFSRPSPRTVGGYNTCPPHVVRHLAVLGISPAGGVMTPSLDLKHRAKIAEKKGGEKLESEVEPLDNLVRKEIANEPPVPKWIEMTSSDLKRIFLLRVKEWHPDRHQDPEDKAKAEERFKGIQMSYRALMKML